MRAGATADEEDAGDEEEDEDAEGCGYARY